MNDTTRGAPGANRPTGARPRLSSGSEYAGAGLHFAATIGLFAYLGYWLDKRMGSSPWLIILGVFAGAGLAFFSLYRRVIKPPAERPK